jgi:hypothetical protein
MSEKDPQGHLSPVIYSFTYSMIKIPPNSHLK